MITPQEIRIGNWICYGTHILKVKDIQLDGWVKVEQYIDGVLEQYDGIPLTPDILEQCGFKYGFVKVVSNLGDEEIEGDTHYWDLTVKISERCDHFQFSIVKFGKGDFTFSNHWLRVPVKSLHQLQNLYFALTGTELNYNRPHQG